MLELLGLVLNLELVLGPSLGYAHWLVILGISGHQIKVGKILSMVPSASDIIVRQRSSNGGINRCSA